jgi:hypothetical protein
MTDLEPHSSYLLVHDAGINWDEQTGTACSLTAPSTSQSCYRTRKLGIYCTTSQEYTQSGEAMYMRCAQSTSLQCPYIRQNSLYLIAADRIHSTGNFCNVIHGSRFLLTWVPFRL